MRKIVLIICLIHSIFSFSNQSDAVVFSELMVDPEPPVGLPDVEYIELYNRSGKTLSLNGWTLFYGEKAYAFPASQIDSAGYCLLCSKSAEKLFDAERSLIVFPSFPALVKTGKAMYVLNEKKELVTCLEYSSDWHANAFKENGGWSLECIDLDNLSGQASNWTSSINEKGGTPGFANSVSTINADTEIPLCTSIYVLSPNQLELTFSKRMRPDVLSDILNYETTTFPKIVSVIPTLPTHRSVILNLIDSLESGAIYNLNLINIEDISDLPLKEKSVSFGLPEDPEPSDLTLNEILFNPLPNGCDYIEFVNVSGKCVDLSQVWLTNKSESGILNAGVRLSTKPMPCVPGSYWLLSVCADSVLAVNGYSEKPNFIDLPSFPSMPDDAGNVVLLTTSAQIIDEMTYKESMHFPLISSCEGVSLEKRNPALSSTDPAFWTSASTTSNYGTPGYQNSQYRDIGEIDSDGFSIENKWITPNNDGLDDLITIHYKVSESSVANLTLYDLKGRVVRHLLKNELLAVSGFVYWDGTSNDGRMVPYGRYILQTECFTPAGKVFKKRFVLTVLF